MNASKSTHRSKKEQSTSQSSPNPKYDKPLNRYNHLKSTKKEFKDTTELLLIYLTLKTSNHAKIKRRTAPKIENIGKPIAEFISSGWTVIWWGKWTSIQLKIQQLIKSNFASWMPIDCKILTINDLV